MKERPILFRAPMVRAILDGRKTVTRRVVKPQPDARADWMHQDMNDVWRAGTAVGEVPEFGSWRCPYGQPGDRLWVREAWRVPASLDANSGTAIANLALDAGYRAPWCPIQYEADGHRNSDADWRSFETPPSIPIPGRYRHARFMPRWASRITLEVTGVRVERLLDISEDGAIAEGCTAIEGMKWHTFKEADAGVPMHDHTAKDAFEALWDSINGAGSWAANPWVWVVEFKRVAPTA